MSVAAPPGATSNRRVGRVETAAWSAQGCETMRAQQKTSPTRTLATSEPGSNPSSDTAEARLS